MRSLAPVLGRAGAGLARVRSAPMALLGVWVVGMLLVVAFEKTNWSIGPSVSGYVHRYASLAAFVALPIGALLLTRDARSSGARTRAARAVRWFSIAALASFAPIVVAIVTAPLTGVPWFRAVPLGLVERVLAVAEVGVVVALGIWAAHAAVVVTRREPTEVRPLVPEPSRGT